MPALPWAVTLAGRMEGGAHIPSPRDPARCSTLPLHLHICQVPYAQTMKTGTYKGTFSPLGSSCCPSSGGSSIVVYCSFAELVHTFQLYSPDAPKPHLDIRGGGEPPGLDSCEMSTGDPAAASATAAASKL